MSSHHIIREDQEPALLIMDANAVAIEQVHELLEWSPTVIVAESALNDVLSWGIKIDVVLTSVDKVSGMTTLLHDQFPLKVLSYNNVDEVLSTALYFLIARKQKAVNIISAAPLENFEAFEALDISVFQLGRKWSLIRSGHFEKWLPAGRTIKTFPDKEEMKTAVEGVISIKKGKPFWFSEQ